MEYREKLESFRPQHEYLVCIDSDGCVFDTMGIKQRECFCPWMIAYFGLQPVAQAARECKEFADLFSKTRGANRHITIKRILTELLPSHPLVKRRNFKVPQFPYYFAWVDNPESVLSNDGLRRAIQEAESEEARRELEHVLEWSERVNWAIAEIVRGIPPFPYARESLERLSGRADVVVVSQTPLEALEREWAEHGIDRYASLICGQEMGTKSQHIAATSRHYEKDHVLMIGDAPGDLKAARDNGALFFPVIPGKEEASWELFYREALDRFFSHGYAGEYEERLVGEFERALPEEPPWIREP
ncbi:TPA: haloacid dehalogenase [Candidatus Acetothermia bacterium]|nr:haloacid dehalogenase [Candidatus Acetothermia bacterium]